MHYQTQMATPDVAKLRGEEAANYLRSRVRACAADYLAYPPAILTAQLRRAGLPVAGGRSESAPNAPWIPERVDFGAMTEEQRGLAAAILAQNIHDDMVIAGANDANLQAGIREYDGFSPQAILAMLSGVAGLMKSWTATVTVPGANAADAMAAEHATLAKSRGGRRSSAGHGLLYLSRAQVAEVCAPCAEEMTRKGLSHLAVDALVKALVGGGEPLAKAAGHKYLSRKPDGHGGWAYEYSHTGASPYDLHAVASRAHADHAHEHARAAANLRHYEGSEAEIFAHEAASKRHERASAAHVEAGRAHRAIDTTRGPREPKQKKAEQASEAAHEATRAVVRTKEPMAKSGTDDIESFRFGDEGSFARCVSALDGRKGVDNAESLCAYLHKQVTGEWPAQKSIRGRGPMAALDALLSRRAE